MSLTLVRKRRPTAAQQRATKIARLGDLMSVRSVYAPRRPVSALPREIKYFDTSFTQSAGNAADWTGTEIACTNYIQSDGTTVGAYTDSALIPSAVGSGYGQVDGSKYILKSIAVRGEVVPGASSDTADMTGPRSVRLVLVQDTMPQGAQAQGESIFTDMGNAAQCNYSYLAKGAGTGGRFRILADKVVLCQPATAGADSLVAATNSLGYAGGLFNMTKSFGRGIYVNIKSSGATPATSQLSDCNIFLLAHASSAAPANFSIQGCARASYID